MNCPLFYTKPSKLCPLTKQQEFLELCRRLIDRQFAEQIVLTWYIVQIFGMTSLVFVYVSEIVLVFSVC